MKFALTREDLHRGLSMVQRAVPGRTPRPILQNICLSASGQQVRLFATDEERGIACWLPATVEQKGMLAVPAKLLVDYVANLGQGMVTFTRQDGSGGGGQTLAVKSTRGSSRIRCFGAEEYPPLPTVDEGQTLVRLEAALLKDLIASVISAAGSDIAFPIFTGILMRLTGEKITLVASDRLRLFERTGAVAERPGTMRDLIVPAATLGELARILPGQGLIDVAVNPRGSQVIFRNGTILLSSRLLEGDYPDYRGLIPHTHTTRAVVQTRVLTEVLREVQPFAQAGSHIVVIDIRGQGRDSLGTGSLTLQATAQDLGDTTLSISASVDGPGVRAFYDSRHLADALAAVRAPEVVIELTTDRAPCAIKPVGAEEFTAVLTPLTKNTEGQESAPPAVAVPA